MKKLVSVVMLVTLSLTLCACGGNSNPLVGTWRTSEGETLVFSERAITSPNASNFAIQYERLDEHSIRATDGYASAIWTYQLSGNTLTINMPHDGFYPNGGESETLILYRIK